MASNMARRSMNYRALLLACAVILVASASSRLRADTGTCGGQMITLPFTDVPAANGFFCSIAQIYFQGITLGTTPTTYNPADGVSREQMAAFLARSQNSTLNRGSRRAALNQFWTTTPQYEVTQGAGKLGTTAVGVNPELVASDGADLWVPNGDGTVSRVRGSDGKLLETWTGATDAKCVMVAMGRVFMAGNGSHLYMLNPGQTAGTVTTVSSALGTFPQGIAFDGQRIWTANDDGSVSIITPGSPSFGVNNVGGFTGLRGIVYDGANMWVTDLGANALKKLDAGGAVLLTVPVGPIPVYPIYDGTNIWVPCNSGSVSVVRPSDGRVLATLTGNGLSQPISAAFDGQRILITSIGAVKGVSLFRAADFAPLGTFSITGAPWGACSDGVNFWITILGPNKLARF